MTKTPAKKRAIIVAITAIITNMIALELFDVGLGVVITVVTAVVMAVLLGIGVDLKSVSETIVVSLDSCFV